MDVAAVEITDELCPCPICERTFLPGPLRKHVRVCEKNISKKRKVFNSLRQRVQGTDLADFHRTTVEQRQQLPVAPPRESSPPKQPPAWKEKHEELVRTIKAARGVPEKPIQQALTRQTPNRQSVRAAVGTMGMTERCPTCDRQFGPKAFDRHVEWCKERSSHQQKSPAGTQEARERLEARTKYRVPPLAKSKRSITRDKYQLTMQPRTLSTTSLRSSPSSEQLKTQPRRNSERPAASVRYVFLGIRVGWVFSDLQSV